MKFELVKMQMLLLWIFNISQSEPYVLILEKSKQQEELSYLKL